MMMDHENCVIPYHRLALQPQSGRGPLHTGKAADNINILFSIENNVSVYFHFSFIFVDDDDQAAIDESEKEMKMKWEWIAFHCKHAKIFSVKEILVESE